MKRFLNFKNLIVILLLSLGVFLRLCNLSQRTVFNADQEWLATRAKNVISGDLALIGPVTSVGNFSIGPGFVYLWTIFSFIVGYSPIAGALLSVFLGTLFLIGIYLFTKFFINEKVALFILLLTAVSSNLVFWDQIPWTPSLFYLSQIILLFGAYFSNKNAWGYPLMSLGLVLGFQSHVGIVLSIIPILIYLLFVKPIKPTLKIIIIALSILFFGFLPNLIFDLTHNFENVKRLADVVKGDGLDYFVGFGKIINILSYNAISLIYPNNKIPMDSILIKGLFALVVANGIRLIRSKKFNKLSFLLLITIILPSLFFYIQQGKFSEYYLMMTVPSLILLVALFLNEIRNRNTILILVAIIGVYLNLKMIKEHKLQFNLEAKREVVEYIVSKAGESDYGISLTTRYGEQFGFDYIFDYYGIKADIPPKKGETKIFSIIIPEGFDGITGLKDFDGIGLIWQGI